MPAVNKEQIAAANLNYRMYPLEFFLDTQKELGLRSIEFCAVAPHFLMDYEGYRDTAPIRAMAEEKGLQIVAFTPESALYQFPVAAYNDEVRELAVPYYKNALRAAAELGAKIMPLDIAGGLKTEKKEDILARAVDTLKKIAPAAEEAGVTIACGIILGNCLHNSFYCKKLLIAANFFDICVVNHEIFGEFTQAALFKQRDQSLVLFCGDSARNNLVYDIRMPFNILFAPYVPEFFPRLDRSILDRIFVCSHDHLHKLEQLGYVLIFLVTDILLNRLHFRNIGSLALNYSKRNPVHKYNDIRTGIFLLVPAVTREFLGHMEHIIFEIIPVDIV